MQLTFLGTADAFSGAGRGNSCYWIDDALGAYTVDFGPTALRAVRKLGRNPDTLDAIYVTHLHGDHIGGLALLIIDQQYRAARARPLTLVGPPGLEERVELLRDSAYPGAKSAALPFELRYVEIPVPGATEVCGRVVRTIRAKHDAVAVAASLRIVTEEADVAFSGDTGWQAELGDFVCGADLFVCECSGVDAGFWGHLSVAEIEANRASIDVRRLVLSHLSDSSRDAACAARVRLNATVADDGGVIDLSLATGPE